MALESTQIAGQPAVASRVVAVAGRFAQPPRLAPADTTIHLLHGEQDAVMLVHFAREAYQQLQALGASPTLDRFTGLGHGFDGRVVQIMVNRINGS